MKGLKIEEVAVMIGVSTQTINRWYKFKKEHPTDSLAQELPDYTLENHSGRTGYIRMWNVNDIWKLTAFKTNLTIGRGGKLGKYGGKGTWREQKSKNPAIK